MLIHWIWLAQRRMSTRLKWETLKKFADPEDVFYGAQEDFRRIRGLKQENLDSLMDRDLTNAQRTLDECNWKGIRILTMQDAAYPKRLKSIADPPILLYYKGILPDFDALPVIGIVGTRHASNYGLEMAKKIGCQVGAGGGLVVSGLALGIDGAAMEGALLSGSRTVGVLGTGVDVIYPRENEDLFARTEQHGCLISEYAPGERGARWHFLSRNRIISGLSCALVVIEAPDRSGSMSTAQMAGDQGRSLFVVPGEGENENYRGSHRLLEGGAVPVTDGWEVLREYQSQFPGRLRQVDVTGLLHRAPSAAYRQEKPAIQKNLNKINIDNRSSGNYIDDIDKMSKLSPEEQAVVDAIGRETRLVDAVIRDSGLPAGKVLGILTMLQLKGIICKVAGNRVKISC